MRTTHNRAQRFGGHTKHTFYCSCGKRVSGNGGKRHFEREGHQRITQRRWDEQFRAALADPGETPACDGSADCKAPQHIIGCFSHPGETTTP